MQSDRYLTQLMRYHDMQIDLLKHYEDARTKISQIILALSAALIGLSSFAKGPAASHAIPVMIMLLGLAGVVFTVKYTSLAHKRTILARRFRTEIGAATAEEGGKDIATVYREHSDAYVAGLSWMGRSIAGVQVRYCWVALHAFVAAIGLALLL